MSEETEPTLAPGAERASTRTLGPGEADPRQLVTEVDSRPLAPQRAAPREVAGYRVLRELAAGGMGVVYLAEDPRLERRVALKLLRGAAYAGQEERERFTREARAAAGLRHPHVVTVHASGETADGVPYLVLDLVEGPSLRERVREGLLPPHEAARLAREVAEGLAAVHALGVLHRDLKPANVLCDAAGRAQLTDFGLARRIEEEPGPGLTETGQLLGTPSYMAPEQARGERVDERSDVYGLGATLYELLTGRPPFLGGGTWQLVAKVIAEDPPRPRELRPGLDANLEAIVLRCLEKEPARRYSSAEAVAEDLARYLAGEPVEARPPGFARRARRLLGRYQRPLLAAGLCASLALVGLLGWSLRARAKAQAPFVRLRLAERLALASEDSGQVQAEVEAALGMDRRAEVLLEAGRVLALAGEAERARALFEEAIRREPPGFSALLELHRLEQREPGSSALGATRFTPALERLIRAARDMGRADGFGLYAAGEELLARGRPAEARDRFSAALARAPRFVWARFGRAAAWEALGDRAAALADLDAALAQDPRVVVAYLLRGALRRELGDLVGARGDFGQVQRLSPESGLGELNLGLLELSQARFDAALAALDRALGRAKQPRVRARALGARALCQLESGAPEEARADALAALREGEDPGALHVLARLAEGEGDESAAIGYLQRVLGADPEHVLAQVALGRLKGELSLLDRAAELAPRLPLVRLERARLRAAQGDYSGARTDLGVALALDPGDAEAYFLRAQVRQLEGQGSEAERDYSNAITADPEWPDPYLQRGVLRAQAGRFAEAATDWEDALLNLGEEDPRRERVEGWLRRLRGSRE